MAKGLTEPLYVVNPVSDVDALYGTYNSLQAALSIIAPNLRAIGRKFGVVDSNNEIKEYVFNGGILDEHAKLVSPTFTSELSPTLEMQTSIGAIPSGTTIADLQGLTFTQYIEQQNFPTIEAYISDQPNLILSGFSSSSVEMGDSYSFSASMSFDKGIIKNGDGSDAGSVSGDALTFKLTNPDGVEYNNNSVVSNSDATTTNAYVFLDSGTKAWTFSATNAVGTTEYLDNKGGSAIVSSIETAKADTTPNNITKSKTAYFPMIYGMSAVDNSVGGTAFYSNSDLTRLVANTTSKSILLDGVDEFIYFGYPSSFGDLTSVIDNNGFNVTGSFTKHVVDVTSVGKDADWTEEYNIYKTNSVTSVSNSNYEFNL